MTRDKILNIIINSFFSLLAVALFYNQVVRFPYYSHLAKNNSIRIIPIDGPRGRIFDRSGVAMVTDRLSFDVAIVYSELGDKNKAVDLLSGTLGMEPNEVRGLLDGPRLRPYAPVTIIEDINKDKAIALEEASLDIDGLLIETRSKRYYPYGEVGCHIFGYLGEITDDELEDLRDYGYRMKDMVGRSGLEKYYEKDLMGLDGGTQIEVDSKGRERRILGLKEPSSGKDLYTTIDIKLQNMCDKLLGENRGAIIVMNPKTGEVLALASHPAFDPNVFVRNGAQEERVRLLRDKTGRPLSDRAISGLYAPGSVFKIVTASGALETRRINEGTYFFCPGNYKLGVATFDCWKEGGHGSQEITAGLMNSCNVFFYNTGRALGVDYLETYAKLFGFGKQTGIDLPDEVKGIVPGRLWKRLYRNEIWYEGETLNYAIGQGYLVVTPIQILDMMAAMANGGSLVKPFIVRRVDKTEVASVKQKKVGLKERVIRKVREGLFKVVNAENGTGRRAKVEGVIAAGKTGTAENPQGKTHAWFSGFAPFDDPKICIVVFLEHGGKGGLGAAEIGAGIFAEAKRLGYI